MPCTPRATQPASPCTNASLPASGLSVNQTVATTNGEPALETNGSTYGHDPPGYATYVISTPAERPANATSACGVNWLPWGPDARGLLILRNMLPAASFTQSIHNATLGNEAATMGHYYPRSRYSTTAAFAALGCSRAATGGAPSSAPSGGAAPGCPVARGRLAAPSLGALTLGMTRRQARGALSHSSTHGRRSMIFFCLQGGGLRVGFPSSRVLHGLSPSVRRRVAGTVVLVLTANPHYALSGVRPGSRLVSAARRLRVGRGVTVGRNTWYVVRSRAAAGAALPAADGVLKVVHGRIAEIGIADRRLLRTRAATRTFWSTFR
jgi:hypothetical protein